jgi:hypothetical protein
LPAERLHLLIARDALKPAELKFFVSNAPPETSVEVLLLVAFSRWTVERCFEDQKSEIGLDQYEGRRYLGLKRHLILSSVSYLFLARVREGLRGEKTGTDRLPAAHRDGRLGPLLGVDVVQGEDEAAGQGRAKDRMGAAAQRRRSEEPHQASSAKASSTWHLTNPSAALPVGLNLAL